MPCLRKTNDSDLAMAQHPLVCILILNWNGWHHTLECLESVFRSDYPNYVVVVCDNNSSDNSLTRIKDWARGYLDVLVPRSNQLRRLTFPPIHKPIAFAEYDKAQAESGRTSQDRQIPLILIQTGANYGYAGGNNVGLRYTMAREEIEYAWLLNNDTVVERDALSELVRRMQSAPRAGMCGSAVMFYQDPQKIWALGGSSYSKWLGASKCIGQPHLYDPSVNVSDVEKAMDNVAGASMLVSRDFLSDVGLMTEDYFIYFEEIDWAIRAKGKYGLAFSSKSLVYHKEGASIGSSSRPTEKPKSLISDYYSVRNRIKFTLRYFPYALPTVYLGLFWALINRIRRRQWSRIGMVLSIMLGFDLFDSRRREEPGVRWS
jgi:GT2 family glycosyltransferase